MRIIKAAKRQDEIIDTCYNCHSMLGISITDINYDSGHYGYKCPICNQRNNFSSSDKEDLFPWIMEDEKDEKKNETTYGPKIL